MKTAPKGVADIDSEDMILLEKRLRGVAAISHGFVFTKDYTELLKWG